MKTAAERADEIMEWVATGRGIRGTVLGILGDFEAEIRAAVVAGCAKAATAAIDDCRVDGESDLRSARAWVDQAIRDPAAYAAERAEMAEALR